MAPSTSSSTTTTTTKRKRDQVDDQVDSDLEDHPILDADTETVQDSHKRKTSRTKNRTSSSSSAAAAAAAAKMKEMDELIDLEAAEEETKAAIAALNLRPGISQKEREREERKAARMVRNRHAAQVSSRTLELPFSSQSRAWRADNESFPHGHDRRRGIARNYTYRA